MGVSLKTIAFRILCFIVIFSWTAAFGYRPCNHLVDRARHGCISQHSECLQKGIYHRSQVTCKCKNGFSGDPKKECKDVDECAAKTKKCHAEAFCKNTIGSFTCHCKDGYKGDGRTCKDVNECEQAPCRANTKCENYGGSYTCSCAQGFESTQKDKTKAKDIECQDVIECADSSLNSCPANTICVNTHGSYTCSCAEGFVSTDYGKTRGKDITCYAKMVDCASHDFCDAKASCINGKCVCKGKTTGSGEKCIDYQPCPKGKNYCRDSKVCLIHPLIPDKCAVLDECEKQGKFCPRYSTCEKDVKGGYNCVCTKGFRLTKTGQDIVCKDIDECKKYKEICPEDKVCHNKVGEHECVCRKDHRLHWDGNCVPKNECDKRGLECRFGSECKANSSDSYDCVCATGFKAVKVGEKVKSCEDKNECLTGESTCSGDRCKNTLGSYTCVPCLPGFTETKDGICVGTIKGSCNCDHKTEDCRHGKCRCKRGHKRNKQGRCVLPPDSSSNGEVKRTMSASCSVSSHISVLFIGVVGCLAFTALSNHACCLKVCFTCHFSTFLSNVI